MASYRIKILRKGAPTFGNENKKRASGQPVPEERQEVVRNAARLVLGRGLPVLAHGVDVGPVQARLLDVPAARGERLF